jgi:hypothetical protein
LPSDCLAVFLAHLQFDDGYRLRAATLVKRKGGTLCIDIEEVASTTKP